MSLAGIVAGTVESFLAQFVEAKDLKQTEGTALEWRCLRLRQDYLTENFGIPVKISNGIIGRLSISLPWNILRSSEMIDVLVEDFFLCLVPTDRQFWDPHEAYEIQKKLRFSAIESICTTLLEAATLPSNTQKSPFDSFLPGFIRRNIHQWLLARIRVTVREVHFRVESGQIGFFPFSAGLIIPSIVIAGSGLSMTTDNTAAHNIGQTVKFLRCSFAVYLNSNDPSAAYPITESVPAPDLLPRTLRLLCQLVARECEDQFPLKGSKRSEVVPRRQRLDLWTNEASQQHSQQCDGVQTVSYIIPPTTIQGRLSSPHLQTGASFGVDLTAELKINLTTSQLQDILTLYLHTKEWNAFVYESVEAPALRKAFACHIAASTRWRSALRQLQMRNQAARLREYWFGVPAVRLLRLHNEYLYLASQEFKLRRTFTTSVVDETIQARLREIECDFSIPLELLLLWRRQTAADATLNHDDLKALGVITEGPYPQYTEALAGWRDVRGVAASAAVAARESFKTVKDTVGKVTKYANKKILVLTGSSNVTRAVIATEEAPTTATMEIDNIEVDEEEVELAAIDSDYFFDIVFESIRIGLTQSPTRFPDPQHIRKTHRPPIPELWWAESFPYLSAACRIDESPTLELTFEKINIELFRGVQGNAKVLSLTNTAATPPFSQPLKGSVETSLGLPPYFAAVNVHEVYFGPARSITTPKQGFYPNGIVFGDRPAVANLFVGAVPSGTRRPNALYVRDSTGIPAGLGLTVFPPSLRQGEAFAQSCEDEPEDRSTKYAEAGLRFASAVSISIPALLSSNIKTENRRIGGHSETWKTEDRPSSSPNSSLGDVPTISYISGPGIHQLQIWRPVIQASRSSTILLSRFLSSLPLLRGQHLQRYAIVVPTPSFTVPPFICPPRLYSMYTLHGSQGDLFRPLNEVQCEAIRRCFQTVSVLPDRSDSTEWRNDIESQDSLVEGKAVVQFNPISETPSINGIVNFRPESAGTEDIGRTCRIVVIDALVVLFSFSRSSMPSNSRRDAYKDITQSFFFSDYSPTSIPYSPVLPDVSVASLHVPLIQFTFSFSQPLSESQRSAVSNDSTEASNQPSVAVEISRVDIACWPHYRMLLLWRLDLEPLSLLAEDLLSGTTRIPQFTQSCSGFSEADKPSLVTPLSKPNKDNDPGSPVSMELTNSNVLDVSKPKEAVALDDDSLKLLLYYGSVGKDMLPFHLVFSMEAIRMCKMSERQRHSSISLSVEKLSVFLYSQSVALTTFLVSSLTDEATVNGRDKPSITRDAASYFQISHHRRAVSPPQFQSLLTSPVLPASSFKTATTESKHLQVTGQAGRASPHSLLSELHREKNERIKLEQTQLAAEKIISRYLNPPTIPSLRHVTRFTTNDVIRSGWLLMKYPKLSKSPGDALQTPGISRGGHQDGLKNGGWTVWVEVVDFISSVDTRRRRHRRRGASSSPCNALWIYRADSVFDRKPLMIVLPTTPPIGTQWGFHFTSCRYVCLSAELEPYFLNQTGVEIPLLGTKGSPVHFEFDVPPMKTPVQTHRTEQTGTGFLNAGRFVLAEHAYSHRSPFDEPFPRCDSNSLACYWCCSLLLDVSRFRVPHMRPPEIRPRSALSCYSDSAFHFYASKMVAVAGETLQPQFKAVVSGVAASWESTRHSGNNAFIKCSDIVVKNVTVSSRKRRHRVLHQDSSQMETADSVNPRRQFVNPNSASVLGQPGLVPDPVPGPFSSPLFDSRLTSSVVGECFSHQQPSKASKAVLSLNQTPQRLPTKNGFYWLPSTLIDLIVQETGGHGRRHFFIDFSINFDTGVSSLRIDPVELVLQPDTTAELSNLIYDTLSETLAALPRGSSALRVFNKSPVHRPPAPSTPVGFLGNGVLRSGTVPNIIHLPDLLGLRRQPTVASSFEVSAVSFSVVLLQAYTGSEIGRISLVCLRSVHTAEADELHLGGCVVSGACQLPVLIAPWTSPPLKLSTLVSNPSTPLSSTAVAAVPDSGEEASWFLHIRTAHRSSRVEQLVLSLADKGTVVPDVSEVSCTVNESRIDLRWEEIPLFYEVCRDIAISTEALRLLNTGATATPQPVLTPTAAPFEPTEFDVRKASDLLEEVQHHIEHLRIYPNLEHLSDVPGSVIEPLRCVARRDPYAYQRVIQPYLNDPNVVAGLNIKVVDALRKLAGAEITPPKAASGPALRLTQIKVSLPSVYLLKPSLEPPRVRDFEDEPKAPLLLRLGCLTVGSEFRSDEAIPPPGFTKLKFLEEVAVLSQDSQTRSLLEIEPAQVSADAFPVTTVQCMQYNIEYEGAVLYHRAESGHCRDSEDSDTVLDHSISSGSHVKSNPPSSSYLSLSTPTEAVLTVWQVLQPLDETIQCGGLAGESDIALRNLPKVGSVSSSNPTGGEILPSLAAIWSSVRLFISVEFAPISAILHPAVWTAIVDNSQAATVLRRGRPLSHPLPRHVINRRRTMPTSRGDRTPLTPGFYRQQPDTTRFRQGTAARDSDEWIAEPDFGDYEDSWNAVLRLPQSIEWASAEALRRRQNTALLGSLASVTLDVTDIQGKSLFRAMLSGCKGQKFGLMHSAGVWIDSLSIYESVSSSPEANVLPILEFADKFSDDVEQDGCCFSWISGPADISAATSLNPSLITTVHISQPHIRIHPTVLGALQLLVNQSDPFISPEKGSKSFSASKVGLSGETFGWSLPRNNFASARLGSADFDRVEPKRLLIWLPLEPLECEHALRERSRSDEFLTETPRSSEKGSEQPELTEQEPGTYSVPGAAVAENVQQLFTRADWLSNECDNCIRNAISTELRTNRCGDDVAIEEALSDKCIGPWEVLHLLGVWRYLDFSFGDEDEDDGSSSLLDVCCRTHIYSLKTDGVIVRIIVPSVISNKPGHRFRGDPGEAEDSFSISASFVAQIIETFLHLTVIMGDEKMQTSLILTSHYDAEFETGNLIATATGIDHAPLFPQSLSSIGRNFSSMPSRMGTNIQLNAGIGTPEHTIARPVSGSFSFDWSQKVLCRLVKLLGLDHTISLPPIPKVSMFSPFRETSTPAGSFWLLPKSRISSSIDKPEAQNDSEHLSPVQESNNSKTDGSKNWNLTSELSSMEPSVSDVVLSFAQLRNFCCSCSWQVVDLQKEEPRRLRATIGRLDIHVDSRDLHALIRLGDWLNFEDDQRPPRRNFMRSRETRFQKSVDRPFCWWERDALMLTGSDYELGRRLMVQNYPLPTSSALQPHPVRSRIKGFTTPEVVFSKYARQRAEPASAGLQETRRTFTGIHRELLDACVKMLGGSITLSMESRSRVHLPSATEQAPMRSFMEQLVGADSEYMDDQSQQPSQPPVEGLPLLSITFGVLKLRAHSDRIQALPQSLEGSEKKTDDVTTTSDSRNTSSSGESGFAKSVSGSIRIGQRWKFCGSINISGFNIDGQCWEPVLEYASLLVDVQLTDRSTDIGIKPKTPIQISLTTGQLLRWRHGALLFQTEVLAGLPQWKIQRKQFWDERRALWFSGVKLTVFEHPYLQKLTDLSVTHSLSRVDKSLRASLSGTTRQLTPTSSEMTPKGDIPFRGLSSDKIHDFSDGPYIVDLMSMRCSVIDAADQRERSSSSPRPLPDSASISFSFSNISGLPIYLYFPRENGWEQWIRHPLAGYYFYVPPNVCVALDSSVLRPSGMPLQQRFQEHRKTIQRFSGVVQPIEVPIRAIRAHIIILTDVYSPCDHKASVEKFRENPRMLSLREQECKKSADNGKSRSSQIAHESAPFCLGNKLGKLVRQVFSSERVFAAVPNVNLVIPKPVQIIKQAGARSTSSNVLLLSGVPAVAHRASQIGMDGLSMNPPIPVDVQTSTHYVISSGFIVKSYFPGRLMLKMLDSTDHVLMTRTITDPGKTCAAPPDIQAKITKIALELDDTEPQVAHLNKKPDDGGELLKSVAIYNIADEATNLDCKSQSWQFTSFSVLDRRTTPVSLPSGQKQPEKLQRHAIVIQSWENVELNSSNIQGKRKSFTGAVAVHSVVVKAPLYVYNGLPVPVKIRVSDNYFGGLAQLRDNKPVSILLSPCSGAPLSACRSLTGLFASFRLPQAIRWSSTSRVWAGEGITSMEKGTLIKELRCIRIDNEGRRVAFECHTSLTLTTPPDFWFGSCGALTMCLLPSRVIISRLPFPGMVVAPATGLVNSVFAGDGKFVPFLCDRHPFKVAFSKVKTRNDIRTGTRSPPPPLPANAGNSVEGVDASQKDKGGVNWSCSVCKNESIESIEAKQGQTPPKCQHFPYCGHVTPEDDDASGDEEGTKEVMQLARPKSIKIGSMRRTLSDSDLKMVYPPVARSSIRSLSKVASPLLSPYHDPPDLSQRLRSFSNSVSYNKFRSPPETDSMSEHSEEDIRPLATWQKIFCFIPSTQPTAKKMRSSWASSDIGKEQSVNVESTEQMNERSTKCHGWKSPLDCCEYRAYDTQDETGVVGDVSRHEDYEWSEPIMKSPVNANPITAFEYRRVGSLDISLINHPIPVSFPLTFGSSCFSPLPVPTPSLSQMSSLIRGLPLGGFRPFLPTGCAPPRPITFSLAGQTGPKPHQRRQFDSATQTMYSVVSEPDLFWYWNGDLGNTSGDSLRGTTDESNADKDVSNGEPYEVMEIIPRFIIKNGSNFDLEFSQPQMSDVVFKLKNSDATEKESIEESDASEVVRVKCGSSMQYHFPFAKAPYRLRFRICSSGKAPFHTSYSDHQRSSLSSVSENSKLSSGSNRETSAEAALDADRRLSGIASTTDSDFGGGKVDSENSLIQDTSVDKDSESDGERDGKKPWTSWKSERNTRQWTMAIPITDEAMEEYQQKPVDGMVCDDIGFWNIYKSCIPLKGEDKELIVGAVRMNIETDAKTGGTSITIAPSVSAPIHIENHSKFSVLVRQFNLRNTELFLRPQSASLYWLSYPPSTVLSSMQKRQIDCLLNPFRLCKTKQIDLDLLSAIISKTPDGNYVLNTGAMEVRYSRNHFSGARLSKWHAFNIYSISEPGPLGTGRYEILTVGDGDLYKQFTSSRLATFLSTFSCPVFCFPSSTICVDVRLEGLTTVVSFWAHDTSMPQYLNLLKSTSEVTEHSASRLQVNIPTASISVVGYQREVFCISIDGINVYAELKSYHLPTHMVDCVRGQFSVDMIQLDHYARLMTLPLRKQLLFGSEQEMKPLGLQESSYVVFRCPSSQQPYEADVEFSSLRGLVIDCFLRNYREFSGPRSFPQLAQYTTSVDKIIISVSPVEITVKMNSLLKDIEDFMASLWTSNPIPVLSHVPLVRPSPTPFPSPSLDLPPLLASSFSLFQWPHFVSIEKLSISNISINLLTIRLHGVEEFLEDHNLLDILSTICDAAIPRWWFLACTRDLFHLASIEKGEISASGVAFLRPANHSLAPVSVLSQATKTWSRQLTAFLVDLGLATNLFGNVSGLGHKTKIGWKVVVKALKSDERRCNDVCKAIFSFSALVVEGAANPVARCTENLTRCVAVLSCDRQLVANVDSRTLPNSENRGEQCADGFVEGMRRFNAGISYIGNRLMSSGWSNVCHHIVLVVIGLAAAILEWITAIVDGVKLSATELRRAHVRRSSKLATARKLPRAVYKSAGAIRPYNADDAELQLLLNSTGFENFWLVCSIKSLGGDRLALGTSRVVHFEESAATGRKILSWSCCLGRLMDLRIVDPNPLLFKQSKSFEIRANFWDTYGNCGCPECRPLYNSVPTSDIGSLREQLQGDGFRKAYELPDEAHSVRIEISRIDRDGTLQTVQVQNVTRPSAVKFLKNVSFIKKATLGTVE